jgi:hypothetical protein
MMLHGGRLNRKAMAEADFIADAQQEVNLEQL